MTLTNYCSVDSEIKTAFTMATADKGSRTNDPEIISQMDVPDAISRGIGFSQFVSGESTFEKPQVMDYGFNSHTFSTDEIDFKVSTAVGAASPSQRISVDENARMSHGPQVEAKRLDEHCLEDMKQTDVDVKKYEADLKVLSLDEITSEEPVKVQDNGFKGGKDKHIATADVPDKGWQFRLSNCPFICKFL